MRMHAAGLKCALVIAALATSAGASSFTSRFHRVSTLTLTVPQNGDVNPYGIAVVPRSVGRLHAGDVLVSNFNASSNKQGTGRTIVAFTPGGHLHGFADIDATRLPGACPGGVGLSTALVVLRSGWVIAGSLPSSDGTSDNMKAGCLLVINANGQVVKTLSGGAINGPWDMTALDLGNRALLFVTNVLNGTVAGAGNTVQGGTVLRIALAIRGNGDADSDDSVVETSRTVIGIGFAERTDPGAMVVGPTGVGLGQGEILYVADSVNNRIIAIAEATERSDAATGTVLSSGGALNDPLGLAIAPDGHVLTVNGADGNLVETTPGGHQVSVTALDTTVAPPGAPGNGTLFGLAIAPGGRGVYFVDDGTNTLNLFH
jgi:hypothetical protein